MVQHAEHVHTDPTEVARLEALIRDLPGNARVAITLRDGTVQRGLVAVLPSLQLFIDPQHREGLNGLFKLELAGGGTAELWLDQIERVEHLDALHPDG